MRLWHYQLIPVLPRQQLLGQWRECCAIAKSIEEKGTPNHILVNPIMDFPIDHFMRYAQSVNFEMAYRGYHTNPDNFLKHFDEIALREDNQSIFEGWHNHRYLCQCLYNLQEKHDRGGISDEEWQPIQEKFGGFL